MMRANGRREDRAWVGDAPRVERSALGMAVVGTGVITVTYGLARFVFGLFMPAIRADMGFGPALAGLIGAVPFITYVVAIVLARRLAERLGARRSAGLATGVGALGLGLVGVAGGPPILALGLAVCGLSTGLATPVMVAAVRVAVRDGMRDRVNATINAGTSLGVAAGAPVLLVFAEAWRPAYVTFALIGVAATAWAGWYLPSSGGSGRAAPPPGRSAPLDVEVRWRVARLTGLALVMGVISAAYWVFGPDLVAAAGAETGRGAWLWLFVGAGGLAGGAAGDLVAWLGRRLSHALAFLAMAGALALLAGAESFVAAMLSASVFGGAYMLLSSLYLVTGTRVLAGRPAMGPVAPFVAVAVGQMIGSPVAGGLVSLMGHGGAFTAFAAVGAGVALASAHPGLWR